MPPFFAGQKLARHQPLPPAARPTVQVLCDLSIKAGKLNISNEHVCVAVASAVKRGLAIDPNVGASHPSFLGAPVVHGEGVQITRHRACVSRRWRKVGLDGTVWTGPGRTAKGGTIRTLTWKHLRFLPIKASPAGEMGGVDNEAAQVRAHLSGEPDMKAMPLISIGKSKIFD